MAVLVIAVATESGVPIFCRKRGNTENVQFSTIASLHGINMFSKCHNITMLETSVDNGIIVWKEYCKSITLIGVATGGLESDLKLLLSYVYDVMIFFVSKKELEALRNVEQIKRDLRKCYPMFDYLMESMDPNVSMNSRPTLLLDLVECVLCPQAQQLQQALEHYASRVGGHWAFLQLCGRAAATTADCAALSLRERRLLALTVAASNGAPIQETLVYLPVVSPNVAFRAVTCKLLADVYVLVVCGATPALAEVDDLVLQCWEGLAQAIKEAKDVLPRNFPLSVVFEPCVLSILLINVAAGKCVVSRLGGRARAAPHRVDALRTFYVNTARALAPELGEDGGGNDPAELCGVREAFWSSEFHKCHAQRRRALLAVVLYAAAVPTHTMRSITNKLLNNFLTNKEIYW